MSRATNQNDANVQLGRGSSTAANDHQCTVSYSTIERRDSDRNHDEDQNQDHNLDRNRNGKSCWCCRTISIRYFALSILFAVIVSLLITCILTFILRRGIDNNRSENVVLTNLTFRMPDYVLPIKYKITFLADLYKSSPANFSLAGWQFLTFEVLSPTRSIFLHAEELEIDFRTVKLWTAALPPDVEPLPIHQGVKISSEVSDAEIQNLPQNQLSSHFYHENFSYFEFQFQDWLVPGIKYTLRLQWNGKFYSSTDLAGVYSSSYIADKIEHYLAVTQFEATNARKAFPCIDEPSMKAIFEIRLLRKQSHKSISNTEITRSAEVFLDGVSYEVDVYKPTPKMSPYLLAFVICDYDYREVIDGGIKYRFWGRTSMLRDLDYIIRITPPTVRFFEREFKVPYALNKLDSVGIPDFSAQAMENWGLITYMETYFYFNEKKASQSLRQQIATLVGHEVAHMWFGNLVTMKWWENLWLKEGFADYYSYIAAAYIEPSLNIMEMSVFTTTQILLTDSLHSKRGLYTQMSSPQEIEGSFDTISYEKASSVVEMMRTTLGADTFRRAIQMYLQWFQFDAVDHTDLLRMFTIQSRIDGSDYDMTRLMRNWILEPNYPVVKIIWQRSNVTSTSPVQTFSVSQRVFLLPGASADRGQQWNLPITVYAGSAKAKTVWFADQNEALIQMNITGASDYRWFLANAGYEAFYRVNYDAQNWREIANSLLLNHTSFDQTVRMQLLDDSFALASANMLDFSVFLNLTLYLRNERDNYPWQVAVKNYGHFRRILSRTEHKQLLQNHMVYLLSPLYAYVGLKESPGDANSLTQLRRLVVDEAFRAALPSWIDNAKRIFAELRLNSSAHSELDSELMQMIRCTAIMYGSTEDWHYMFAKYNSGKRTLDRVSYASALACSQNVSLIEQLLVSLRDNTGFGQEFYEPFSAICANPAAHEVALQVFFDNLDEMWSNDPSLDLLYSLFDGSGQEADLVRLMSHKQRFEELGPAAATLLNVMRSIEKNMLWLKTHQHTIISWLTSFSSSFASLVS